MLTITAEARLPTEHGDFRLLSFGGLDAEHVALVMGEPRPASNVLMRIHSECLTGEVFGSRRCDCGPQLASAMQKIAAEGAGMILYMRQEGRGIGLSEKLRAYELQDKGMDTVEANQALGHPADARDFSDAVLMLKAMGVRSVRIMTNNPRKIRALEDAGIVVLGRVPLLTCVSTDNAGYMQTKAVKLGHMLDEQAQKNRA